VAKKKGSRKTARKAATPRRTTRKAPSRPPAPRAPVSETGLENPKQVNLKPLKAIITSQIKRLETYEPRPEVENALKLLRETKTMLSQACVSTRLPMVIEI
jgi:hypothetical protein